MCVSHSVVSNSSWPPGLEPASLFYPWNSPGKNTGMVCHSSLQRVFPTQISNPGLPHCRQIVYHLSHKGSPSIKLQETLKCVWANGKTSLGSTKREDINMKIRHGLNYVTKSHSGVGLLSCNERSGIVFIIFLCTKLFTVSGIFYSNCVCSIFCLSCWTMISGKANTIYPQISAHDCSLNIWGMIESAYLWLSTSSDTKYSVWVIWTEWTNVQSWDSWLASTQNFSEVGGKWIMWHSQQQ